MRSMRLFRCTLAAVVVVCLSVPSIPVSAVEDGRRWPRGRCDATPHNRPAIVSMLFEGAPWSYRQALRAMRRTGIPTNNMRKNGRERWDGFVQAYGVVGDLVPAARRLRRRPPPEERLDRPYVWTRCAGHRDNPEDFVVWIRRPVEARTVIARHGGRERVTGRIGPDGQGARMFVLRRRPHSGTVQRAIVYLRDPDVFYAELNWDQEITTD